MRHYSDTGAIFDLGNQGTNFFGFLCSMAPPIFVPGRRITERTRASFKVRQDSK
jgi:hypothetical protein